MPDHFMPVLEETGMINAVGEWVLETACQQLAQWRSQGLDVLKLCINLSSRQFSLPGLSKFVETVLTRHGIPAEFLELDITESMMLSQEPVTMGLFEDFVDLGVQLAIDDFGTGYSSLRSLAKLPVNTLKIDRSFISEVLADKDSAAITRAIIRLGEGLNLNLVAEGVETEQQLRYLSDIGCHVMQGFLFCKPMPADEAGSFVLSQPLDSGYN